MNGLDEIWRPIKGYEGRYEVSSIGNIRSWYSPNGWRSSPVAKQLQTDKHGYFVIGLYLNNAMKLCKVHRLVAEAFIPNPKNKTQVNHVNANKQDNYFKNLEWATPLENTRHARNMNLYPRCDGDFSSSRIHTAHEVSLIKRDLLLGVPSSILFKRYPKLNSKHLYTIKHETAWKNVKPATVEEKEIPL